MEPAQPRTGEGPSVLGSSVSRSASAGARSGAACQVPSWNENMNCFSNVAIKSENISRRYSHY
jgi:hypothetical protein